MAYQLKTTGIAANCTVCLAVDPDTGTIKDFASAAVTADMLVGSNVTIGEQSWDGITRKYWRPGSGTADADFVKFGTNKPTFTINDSVTQSTVVWIGEVAGQAARIFGNNSSEYFASENTGLGAGTTPTAIVGTVAMTASSARLTAGTKRILAWSLVRGGGTDTSFVYHAADDASASTAVSRTLSAVNVSYALTYVNRRNDNTTKQQDKTHAILIFNSALTQSQIDSLRDDWFGELFEVAGGGGATTTISATLANITGSVASKSSPKTTISATLANITGSVASKSSPKTTISATLANVTGSLASGSGSRVTTITATLGNVVGAITSTGSTANGTFTSEALKDYAGNVLANTALNFVRFYNDTTGALVLNKTGVSTNGSGIVTFSDAALVAGTTYRVDWETAAGSRRMPRKAAA